MAQRYVTSVEALIFMSPSMYVAPAVVSSHLLGLYASRLRNYQGGVVSKHLGLQRILQYLNSLSEVILCRMAGCNQVNIQIHVINRSGRYAQLTVAVEVTGRSICSLPLA